jgi:hypothetical protein
MSQHHDRSGKPSGPERRKEPRDDHDSEDWESLALRRVAGRVRSLDESDDDAEFGWERAVLERLRRRLDDADGG